MIVTYFEAWQLWFAGQLTTHHVLYGLTIQTWSRYGKILSFVSGAILVIELFGVERMQQFGQSLRSRTTLKNTLIRIWQQFTWIWLFIRAVLTTDKKKSRELNDKVFETGLVNIFVPIILSVIYTAWFATYNLSNSHPFATIILSVSVFGLSYGVFVLLLVFIIRLPLLIASSVIRAILIFIAWILQRPNLARQVKIFSIILLFVGFHFDLLGS